MTNAQTGFATAAEQTLESLEKGYLDILGEKRKGSARYLARMHKNTGISRYHSMTPAKCFAEGIEIWKELFPHDKEPKTSDVGKFLANSHYYNLADPVVALPARFKAFIRVAQAEVPSLTARSTCTHYLRTNVDILFQDISRDADDTETHKGWDRLKERHAFLAAAFQEHGVQQVPNLGTMLMTFASTIDRGLVSSNEKIQERVDQLVKWHNEGKVKTGSLSDLPTLYMAYIDRISASPERRAIQNAYLDLCVANRSPIPLYSLDKTMGMEIPVLQALGHNPKDKTVPLRFELWLQTYGREKVTGPARNNWEQKFDRLTALAEVGAFKYTKVVLAKPVEQDNLKALAAALLARRAGPEATL